MPEVFLSGASGAAPAIAHSPDSFEVYEEATTRTCMAGEKAGIQLVFLTSPLFPISKLWLESSNARGFREREKESSGIGFADDPAKQSATCDANDPRN